MFHVSPLASGGFLLTFGSLACRIIIPVSAFIFLWPLFLFFFSCLCVCLRIAFFHKDASLIGLGPTPNDLILACLPLYRPYHPIRSHSEVMGIRISANEFFRGHNSTRKS